MPDGITNLEIDKFFENEENEDIEKKLDGSLFDWFNYEIYKILRYYKKRNVKCPFVIFNTDKQNKPVTHWWSFLDVYLKNIFIIL